MAQSQYYSQHFTTEKHSDIKMFMVSNCDIFDRFVCSGVFIDFLWQLLLVPKEVRRFCQWERYVISRSYCSSLAFWSPLQVSGWEECRNCGIWRTRTFKNRALWNLTHKDTQKIEKCGIWHTRKFKNEHCGIWHTRKFKIERCGIWRTRKKLKNRALWKLTYNDTLTWSNYKMT